MPRPYSPTPTNVRHVVRPGVFLVSKTDIHGTITYANPAFIEISGYTEEELLGQPHNMVRHPDMPRAVFQLLWETIKSGEEFWGYVKNLAKDGGYYWVYAHVTPTFDTRDGKIIGYHSDRRPPKEENLAIIEPLYARMREAEQRGGIEAGRKVLESTLEQKGMSYEEFMFSL
ncbi:PAS domain S-box protein [Candidatus Parcubacteria bacterium]|nr:MAG: PAS domain S-box protein [Candidatus Parcubacteria bacterium]